MDQRQTQIRERAGLEESRLNQEFIDFLSKWSTPILLVLAVAALGYVGWKKLEKSRLARADQAFSEFEGAANSTSPNPASFEQIAAEYAGVRGVPMLAYLEAADVYLGAVRSRMKVGSQVNPDGTLKNPEDALGEGDRATYLDKAQALYEKAAKEASTTKARLSFRAGAVLGLAAVAECRGQPEDARSRYTEALRLLEGTPFADLSLTAKNRLESLDALATSPRLYSLDELPKAAPVVPPAGPDTPATGPVETAPPPPVPAAEQPPATQPPGGGR